MNDSEELIRFINDMKQRMELPKKWNSKVYQYLSGFDGASIAEGFDNDEDSDLAIRVYNKMLSLKTLSSKKIADELLGINKVIKVYLNKKDPEFEPSNVSRFDYDMISGQIYNEVNLDSDKNDLIESIVDERLNSNWDDIPVDDIVKYIATKKTYIDVKNRNKKELIREIKHMMEQEDVTELDDISELIVPEPYVNPDNNAILSVFSEIDALMFNAFDDCI